MEKVSEEILKDLFGFEAPSEQKLASISIWAQRALELKANIEQIEQHLSLLQKELIGIERINLPAVLAEAGMSEFKLDNGAKIKIEDVIEGGLSKDPEKRDFTMQYVIKEGGGDIIKDNFEISFPKGRYSDAIELRKLLTNNKVSFDEFEAIHAMTLKAFLREKLKAGEIVPFEDLGIFHYKKAEIKLPKAK